VERTRGPRGQGINGSKDQGASDPPRRAPWRKAHGARGAAGACRERRGERGERVQLVREGGTRRVQLVREGGGGGAASGAASAASVAWYSGYRLRLSAPRRHPACAARAAGHVRRTPPAPRRARSGRLPRRPGGAPGLCKRGVERAAHRRVAPRKPRGRGGRRTSPVLCCCPYALRRAPARGTRRVRLVRGEGRGVST
jgi:hypothetical protein